MVGLFRVHDVREGDEAQTANVGCVERAVVGGCVFAVGMCDEVFGPGRASGFANTSGVAGDVHGSGLMSRGHDDLDIVGVEMAVCDGDGGGVEDWGNVVFCSDMRRNGRRGGRMEAVLLNVTFEDLGRGGRDHAWRGGAHGAAGRGGEAV